MSGSDPAAPEVHSPFAGERAPVSPRADLLAAAVLLAFGLAVLALSLRMPTFAEQSGTGLTAPGIVPGFHGTVIALLALVLGLRAVRRGALRGGAPGPARAPRRQDALRLSAAAALGTLYAGFLVGRLPFWLATALFVFAFTAGFEWPRGPAGRGRRLAEAAALGLGTGWAVQLVFEDLFLVRLP
ncbi:tripartite tricarboxylate transporter TctB family protein [Caldovatus aquaticus]|uniref:Tripartite tricarboxylate transporter TctB family protein n=1 Tax=Caldovatus aquaticus TaxID=2865671 RepID=A0ABS7F3C7_9PROT|nr:tripartite tricarboxylate transporter TctB family protein [Caldovatus aquaticus]MBW8269803.1 tripartite tricarboxylate transporter TctB family protein [Caldovatus aquaticus]